MPGGVDLGDQSVDDHVGVGHQRDGVAANDRQAAAMLGQLGQHAVLIGFAKRNDVRFRRGILGSLKQRPKLLTARQLPPAQAVFANQQIQPQSNPGLEKDDRQPRQARGGLLLSQHNHRQHGEADHPLARRQHFGSNRRRSYRKYTALGQAGSRFLQPGLQPQFWQPRR